MGVEGSLFARPLVRTDNEDEAEQLRSLHLKLRRNYRGNQKVKQLVTAITQLQLQRSRLIASLDEFRRFLS